MDEMTIFFVVVGVIVVLVLLCGILYQYFPVIETYRVESEKLFSSQRIVLLTDLHGCRHGKKNEKLLRMVDSVRPDFVCVAGDMTVKNGRYTEDILELMQNLSDKYSVYYAPGNHEIRMPEYEKYRYKLCQMGVQYLENRELPIGGNIMIYGLDLPEYWYHKIWQKRELRYEDLTDLMGNCRLDCFSILLAHNPEYFLPYVQWGADLILSGHIHGGIVRVPWFGGVISPTLQLFPTYDAGCFEEKGHHMILSRGLGLHHIKLRLFNRPEISLINLSCKGTGK